MGLQLANLGPFEITAVGQSATVIPAGQWSGPDALGTVVLYNYTGFLLEVSTSSDGPQLNLQPGTGNIYEPPSGGGSMTVTALSGSLVSAAASSIVTGQVVIGAGTIGGSWPQTLSSIASTPLASGGGLAQTGASTATATGTSTSFNVTPVSSSNSVFLAVQLESGTVTSTVSATDATCTLIKRVQYATGDSGTVELWEISGLAAGANTIGIAFSGSVTFFYEWAELSGVTAVGTPQTSTASSATSVTSGSVTTSAGGFLVGAYIATYESGSSTTARIAAPSFQIVGGFPPAPIGGLVIYPSTPAATETFTLAANNSYDWATIAVALAA